MPCLYAIERSVPRKTSRSKPDNTPAIWSWCFPINCSTAFLHSFTMCRVQTTRILRRQERLTLRLRQRRAVSIGVSRQTAGDRVREAEKYVIETAHRMGIPARVELGDASGAEPYLE